MAPFDGTELGAVGAPDGLGMAPRVGEPESNLIPGMAAPEPLAAPPGGPEALLGPAPANIIDTSTAAPQPPGLTLQEVPSWTYDVDPATNTARAQFNGEVLINGAPVVAGGVASFNTRTGAVVLSQADVSAVAVGSFDGRTGAVTLQASDVSPFYPGLTGGQTFLAADVALNATGTVFNVLNTGAIGAAGQIFDIEASFSATNPSAVAGISFGIFDGTVYQLATVAHVSVINGRTQVTVSVRVTLAGPTTFTMRAQDPGTTTSVIASFAVGGPFGTNQKATYIKWTRVA